MDNKSLSHTKWKCQYHIVFIPKYRKKILYGRVRNDVREIISTLCKYKDVDNIVGAVCVQRQAGILRYHGISAGIHVTEAPGTRRCGLGKICISTYGYWI